MNLLIIGDGTRLSMSSYYYVFFPEFMYVSTIPLKNMNNPHTAHSSALHSYKKSSHKEKNVQLSLGNSNCRGELNLLRVIGVSFE